MSKTTRIQKITEVALNVVIDEFSMLSNMASLKANL